MRYPALFLSLALLIANAACGPAENENCTPSADPVLRIGEGVGGAFEEFTDAQETTLSVAPQGGFGVAVVLETQGLTAGADERVDIRLATEIDGEETGDFLLENAPLLCKSNGEGGSVAGVVVGFDPARYGSNDDLLELNGSVVELVVTITTSETEVVSRKPVTLRVGG